MLRFLFALSVAALTLSNAAEARVSWFGRAVITAVQGAACAADGIGIGQVLDTAFFPSGITDNGPDTHLTFYSGATAFSLQMVGRPVANKNYTAGRINSYGKLNTGLTGKIVSFAAPANFGATTAFLNITIAIGNWDGTTGCTATLAIASTVRRQGS